MREVIIADDHPLFRDALKRAVSQALPGALLIEADSVAALQQQAEAHADADLLLLDLHMPGAHGFSALVNIRALHPELPGQRWEGLLRGPFAAASQTDPRVLRG